MQNQHYGLGSPQAATASEVSDPAQAFSLLAQSFSGETGAADAARFLDRITKLEQRYLTFLGLMEVRGGLESFEAKVAMDRLAELRKVRDGFAAMPATVAQMGAPGLGFWPAVIAWTLAASAASGGVYLHSQGAFDDFLGEDDTLSRLLIGSAEKTCAQDLRGPDACMQEFLERERERQGGTSSGVYLAYAVIGTVSVLGSAWLFLKIRAQSQSITQTERMQRTQDRVLRERRRLREKKAEIAEMQRRGEYSGQTASELAALDDAIENRSWF